MPDFCCLDADEMSLLFEGMLCYSIVSTYHAASLFKMIQSGKG